MTYAVKEIYATLQGEGLQAGRVAVFCRFAGCNLWNGLEEARAAAICDFCDTDFVGTDGPGGGKYADAAALAHAVEAMWPGGAHNRYVVCTGGEPLLQLDDKAIQAFHSRGFQVAVETNGTLKAPRDLDWVCVSPKAGAPLVQQTGDELKLVYPQTEFMPEQFNHLAFQHFLLQPLDGPNIKENTQKTIRYCLDHPQWRFSLQAHKVLGLP